MALDMALLMLVNEMHWANFALYHKACRQPLIGQNLTYIAHFLEQNHSHPTFLYCWIISSYY